MLVCDSDSSPYVFILLLERNSPIDKIGCVLIVVGCFGMLSSLFERSLIW